MHCCDKSNNVKCRENCKLVMSHKSTTIQDIINGLQMGGCETPLLQVRVQLHFIILLTSVAFNDFFFMIG